MNEITEYIINKIIRNANISGLSDKQHKALTLILNNKEYKIYEKINCIMEELNLVGQIYRKKILDALGFYL